MSESIRRKSSSRQMLQNLIRVTAQRSQEDAEEVERERRRRARERQRGEGSPSWPEPPQLDTSPHDTELDEELKPRCCLVLEEDEGFSDWSHRLENRNEPETQDDCRAREQRSTTPQWKQESEEKQQEHEEEQSSQSHNTSARPTEKISSTRKEVRTSYSSSVFLPQDVRLPDRTSYLVAGTMKPRGGTCRVGEEVKQEAQREKVEVQPDLRREWRSAESRQSYRDEDDEEEEELSFTHEQRGDSDGRTKRHSEGDEQDGMSVQRSAEGRRSDEMSRISDFSVCSSDGEETFNCYGPMSPTFKKLLIQFYPDEANSKVLTDGKCKIIERTESLRKSHGSVKKTLPPLPVSKINKKLEQYTHALEVSSKDGRAGGPMPADLGSPAEPVSLKKNLFEAGDAWNQNTIPVTPSKDADGIKVGVADLINQWVRGSEDLSRCSSPFKPAESSAGKRFKFVVTGHGKYEKVPVDQDGREDTDCQSGGHIFEDL